ncbi:hypothetical protein TNIN_254731 [Trichonephila inaurata madagascariensis]|uniref:Uncharacterized protein n=1 Tax=Trichonephila inaurata madagascariensis TaxID=2747483 RepID=A0A8X6X7C0_9ARAC|nr:hypothetical protein TNIN_254731 [Trichonephila inaurata madagascariensis]
MCPNFNQFAFRHNLFTIPTTITDVHQITLTYTYYKSKLAKVSTPLTSAIFPTLSRVSRANLYNKTPPGHSTCPKTNKTTFERPGGNFSGHNLTAQKFWLKSFIRRLISVEAFTTVPIDDGNVNDHNKPRVHRCLLLHFYAMAGRNLFAPFGVL